MSKEAKIEELKTALATALDFYKRDLEQRSEWGEITFTDAQNDLKRSKQMLDELNILPVDQLPEDVLTQIIGQVNAFTTAIGGIDSYTIKQANPEVQSKSLMTTLKAKADSMYKIITPHIPYLAYMRGDVASNIQKLSETLSQASNIVEKTKDDMDDKKEQVDQILSDVKAESAKVGVAGFTDEFNSESVKLNTEANKWLKYTSGFACTSLLFAIAGLAMSLCFPATDSTQVLQISISKLLIISILATATLWCGKVYKALKHQSSNQRHRALGLMSLKSLINAAHEPQVKDAVLLEVTKSIYGQTSTGYIQEKQADSNSGSVKVVEVVKNIVEASE